MAIAPASADRGGGEMETPRRTRTGEATRTLPDQLAARSAEPAKEHLAGALARRQQNGAVS